MNISFKSPGAATIWTCKSFNELSPLELYQILQLRSAVFVVEQRCPFQDLDDKDQGSHHLMGSLDGRLIAYTRLVPAGISYRETSIGRVVTSPAARHMGLGKELMERSIQTLFTLYGPGPIRIGAQRYLEDFYASFGFRQTSDIYLEDGIEHIEMLREYPGGNNSNNWNPSN
jgi:ElaA protein